MVIGDIKRWWRRGPVGAAWTGRVDHPEARAAKVLKHRYWGDAADRLIRLRCRDGKVTDWDPPAPPVGAGDAWGAEEAGVPF